MDVQQIVVELAEVVIVQREVVDFASFLDNHNHLHYEKLYHIQINVPNYFLLGVLKYKLY